MVQPVTIPKEKFFMHNHANAPSTIILFLLVNQKGNHLLFVAMVQWFQKIFFMKCGKY